jgi:hypothetical protein
MRCTVNTMTTRIICGNSALEQASDWFFTARRRSPLN